MKAMQETKDFAVAILNAMLPILDEKQQRQLAGIIASKLGYGGVSFVSSITKQSRNTITAGANSFSCTSAHVGNEINQQQIENSVLSHTKRIRNLGGGRKPIEDKYPDLAEEIEEIIRHLRKSRKAVALHIEKPEKDC